MLGHARMRRRPQAPPGDGTFDNDDEFGFWSFGIYG